MPVWSESAEGLLPGLHMVTFLLCPRNKRERGRRRGREGGRERGGEGEHTALWSQKGINLIMRTFRTLPPKGPNSKCHHSGAGGWGGSRTSAYESDGGGAGGHNSDPSKQIRTAISTIILELLIQYNKTRKRKP